MHRNEKDTMRDILLIQSSGRCYGVWKDEVESVQDVRNLHRLPLSPACIAGVTIIDARTVTLADLLVCIGRPGASDSGNRRILILAAAEKNIGFLIAGDTETLSIPLDQVLPMPAYLSTQLISSCFVRGDVLVPIISLSQLHRQLLKVDEDVFRASFTIPPRDQEAVSQVMVYRSDNELFAVLTSGRDEGAVPAGPITELSLVPLFIKGIGLHQGQVLPVIDLGQRIRRRRTANAGRMIVHRIGRVSFGLLVDEVHAVIPLSEAVRADLPRLARPSWITSAVLLGGAIVPLLDLEALLSGNTPVDEHEKIAEHYTADSQFPSSVNVHPVEVVEFSLLGARHALPRSEVEDIVPFRAFRTIPDVPEIVLGVTEHEGCLLPVLDLAMVFGRRSLVSSAWSMMLVRNGDFRAFVITESAFGERSLPLEVQRTLPIVLPHRVVYACYPDADAVRLILNVQSIAVHFEKSLVQELLPALSSEMKLAPAELVPSLLDAESVTAGTSRGAAPEASSAETDVSIRENSQIAEAPSMAITGSGVPTHGDALPIGHGADQATGEPVSKEASAKADENAARQKEEPEEVEPLSQTSVIQEQASWLLPDAEASTDEKAAAGETAPAEEPIGDETASAEVSGGKTPKPTPPEQTLPVPAKALAATSEEDNGSGSVAAGQQTPDEAAAPFAVERSQSQPLPVPESLVEQEPETEPEVGREPPVEVPAVMVLEHGTKGHRGDQQEKWRHEKSVTRSFAETQPQPVVSVISDEKRDLSAVSGRSRRLLYAVIAAALAVLIFIVSTMDTSNNARQISETAASKADPGTAPEITQPVEKRLPERPLAHPTLVLEIPVEKHFPMDVYMVVKDDTLWSISERFTGNPFNYPKIAGENRIADPDLIFPGQRIRLKKKE